MFSLRLHNEFLRPLSTSLFKERKEKEKEQAEREEKTELFLLS